MDKVTIELNRDEAVMLWGLCASKNWNDNDVQNMMSNIFHQIKRGLQCKEHKQISCWQCLPEYEDYRNNLRKEGLI